MKIVDANIIFRYQFSQIPTKSVKCLCKLTLKAILIDFVLKLFYFFQKVKAA